MNLTFEYIQSLALQREGVDVEFKESTGQLDRGMETLCGMLNGDGGIVVFGVKNNGKIVGQEVADKTTRMIGEALNRFEPAVDMQPVYIPMSDSDRQLIVFEVDGASDDKPYTYDGRAYQRHDSVTTVMPRDKYLKLAEASRGFKYKWEGVVNPELTMADLDTKLIRWVLDRGLKNGRIKGKSETDNPETILRHMKLMRDGKLTNGAAILFGKDLYGYPQMKVRMARFKGLDKRVFIDNRMVEGNVFEIYDAANDFFFKHLNLTSHLEGWVRVDELEIPIEALRECVLNALAHRDWRRESSSIGIAIYDDRIEVENAGRFPYKLSPNIIIKDETVQEKNASDPPNPIIADVLYYSGLIEQWGRGIALMFDECKRVNAPAPKINDDGFIVSVIFPRPKLDDVIISRNSVDDIVDENNQYALMRRSKNDKVEQQNSKSRTVEQLSAENRTVEQLSGDSKTAVGAVSLVIHQYEPSSRSVGKLILALGNNILTAVELREAMGLKSKGSFHTTYIKPALEDGAIVANNQTAPKDPNQRYRLTDKGLAYYYQHRNL